MRLRIYILCTFLVYLLQAGFFALKCLDCDKPVPTTDCASLLANPAFTLRNFDYKNTADREMVLILARGYNDVIDFVSHVVHMKAWDGDIFREYFPDNPTTRMKVEGAFRAVYSGLYSEDIRSLVVDKRDVFWACEHLYEPGSILFMYVIDIRTRILRLIMYALAGHTNGPATVHICALAYKKLPNQDSITCGDLGNYVSP
ncbi:hypothetical protein K440DRAFT_644335 [Wilcoxina mikolae CBS 423.85]|nr:hypothetical protein K440DRAFT_644335 [Wilcoxina mikolae CBS 423.85]